MNIKQFFVIKACDKLPEDIRYIIWHKVKENAANIIRNNYILKVNINVDIFTELMELGNIPHSQPRLSFYFIEKIEERINNYIKFIENKITYKYIQEPAIWIDYLTTISYFYNVPIHNVVSKIKNGNIIYSDTGIAYWNNL
jgi:hypothetical protein